MRPEIVIGPVGHPHQLDPAETLQRSLGVPAVCRVVGHLVFFVLSEPETVAGEACLHEELVGAGHVVGENLVSDDPPIHRLLDGHLPRLATLSFLVLFRVEDQLQVFHLVEPGVRLVLGVDEYLGLCLRELSQTDHPLPGRDLVSVGFSDLDRAEG